MKTSQARSKLQSMLPFCLWFVQNEHSEARADRCQRVWKTKRRGGGDYRLVSDGGKALETWCENLSRPLWEGVKGFSQKEDCCVNPLAPRRERKTKRETKTQSHSPGITLTCHLNICSRSVLVCLTASSLYAKLRI